MASNYTPAAGNIRFIRGYDDPKKILLSTFPRSFQSGSMLWMNKVSGRYQAEPALLSVTNATADHSASNSSASTYTTLDLCNAAFAPLFLGIAAGARIPQQLNSFGQFTAAGNATAAVMDASAPFIGYYDRGTFSMPVGPTLSSTGVLTSAVDPGTLVYADGFVNEGTTGFYDPAGALQKDTDYYNYNNCVTTTSTAADAIGIVVERCEIGSPVLIVQLQAAPFAVRLGGV